MKAFNLGNLGRAPFAARVVTVAGVQAIIMPYMYPIDMKEKALIKDAVRHCAAQGVSHRDLKPAHVGQFSARKGGDRPVGFTDFGRHILFDPCVQSECDNAERDMRKKLFGEFEA